MEKKRKEESLSKDQSEKCQLIDLRRLLIKELIITSMRMEKRFI